MADEVASLEVKITGDASELEAAIRSTEKELNGLNKLQGKNVQLIAEMTRKNGGFRSEVVKAEENLRKKQKTLQSVETAYRTNSKSIQANISQLHAERKQIDGLITTKQREIQSLNDANKVINKGSQSYEDNVKAIQWTQTELDSLQKRRGEINKSITSNHTALKQEIGAYNNAKSAVEQAAKSYDNLNGKLKAVEQQERALDMIETGGNLKTVSESIDTMTKPLQKAALITAAGGVAAAKWAIDFEDNFANVKKTVEGTPEQLEKVKKGIIGISTSTPTSTAELTELAAAGGQLGIATENILSFTEVMAQMGTATNLRGEEGAATLARLMNVMGEGQGNIRNMGSAIVDLGNNSATTEAEIAAMALRMGKYAKTVNIGTADVLGYSAALSSLGIEAQAGGSAIGRTWLSIETSVAKGGTALDAMAKYAGKSAKQFQKQWSTDPNGAFIGLLEGLAAADNLTLALEDIGVENTLDIQAMAAMVNGIDLVKASLERSNRAWRENTALQTEFDAKSQTTQSQLAMAKNNIVEAGRSIGESFLPMVAQGSVKVADFAQKIAGMNDKQKETLIDTGKWVIGMGAAAKGTAGLIKGVGTTVETIGKLKTVAGAGGAVGVLAKMAIAAGPVAAAVAGIGIAAYGVKKGYDAWYNSQYRWTRGLSDGNAEIRESMESLKALNQAQQEIKTQRLIIENPESSKEQVEQAKAKLREIADMLEKEYNLKINTEDSGQKLEETVNQLKTINKNDLQMKMNNQIMRLAELKPKTSIYKQQKAELEADSAAALQAQTKYSQLTLKIEELDSAFQAGIISEQDWKDGMVEVGEALGQTADRYADMAALRGIELDAADGYRKATKELTDANTRLQDLTASYDEYRAISTEMANWNTELLGVAALEGDAETVNRILPQMAALIKGVELDMHGYAIAAAEALNGQGSLSQAWSQGGEALDNLVNDYIRAGAAFGQSAQQTAVGAALIKNGFTSIEQATNAGALDTVTRQANELAQTMGGLEGFHIEVSATGDISLISEADGKVKALQMAGGVDVKVDANGNISILDEAGNQLGYINQIGAVSLSVNADGNIEVLDEAGNNLATIEDKGNQEINVDVSANVENAQVSINDLNNQAVSVPINGNVDSAKAAIAGLNSENVTVPVDANTSNAVATIESLDGKQVTITVNAKVIGMPQARGTQNFPGGLAVINDQRGVPDPRELVEVGGKHFLFEGRDVVLPLPKHAKVYTASQTQAMLGALDVPQFAGGYNVPNRFKEYIFPEIAMPNVGKAFQGYKGDKWNDPTSAIANTILLREKLIDKETERLDQLIDLAKREKDYAKATDLTNEKIEYQTQRSRELEAANERLKASVREIETASGYDTSEWFDQLGNETEAYFQILNKAGEDEQKNIKKIASAIGSLTRQIVDNSEESFNAVMELIDAQRERVDLITERIGRVESVREHIGFLAEKNNSPGEQLNQLTALQKDYHDAAQQLRSMGYGEDSDAIMELQKKWWDAEDSRENVLSAIRTPILERRKKDRDNWKKIRDTFDDWEVYQDSPTAFYQRIIEDTEAAWQAGLYGTDWNAMMDDKLEATLNLYQAKQEEINKDYDDRLAAFDQKWEVSDRYQEMEKLREKVHIYSGAVTARGQKALEEYETQLEQLRRDEEKYQLVLDQKEALQALKDEYTLNENNRSGVLQKMQVDMDAISERAGELVEAMKQAIGALQTNISNTYADTNDNRQDNRQINIYVTGTADEATKQLAEQLGRAASFYDYT